MMDADPHMFHFEADNGRSCKSSGPLAPMYPFLSRSVVQPPEDAARRLQGSPV